MDTTVKIHPCSVARCFVLCWAAIVTASFEFLDFSDLSRHFVQTISDTFAQAANAAGRWSVQ